MEIWQTANRYHFFHLLAVFAVEVGVACGLTNARYPLIFWSAGLTLFSGSLYVYALSGVKLFAILAPLGGLSLALGWLALLAVKGRT